MHHWAKRWGRRALLTTFLCAGAGTALAQEVIEPGRITTPQRPEARPGEYIVTFKPGATGQTRALAAIGSGATLRFDLEIANAVAMRNVSPSALSALRSHPLVASVVPDRLLRASAKPGTGGGGTTPGSFDSGSRQVVSYEVQRVGLPSTTSSGAGIGVAIVDSGIDLAHSDLAANISPSSFNAFAPGTSCQDGAGHGTHIAGMLAAVNNNEGIVGVAPGVKLYCVKVLNELLEGTESESIAGLQWVLTNRNAVTPNIRVVNFSLGRPLAAGETPNSGALFDAIQALYAAGVVVVVSAGNDSNVEVTQMVPSGFSNVLAVGATTATGGLQLCSLIQAPALRADAVAGFTTDGAFIGGRGITISAPGEEREDWVPTSTSCIFLAYGTLSTRLGGGIGRKIPMPATGMPFEARGTSFSAPLVSGAVARILQLGKVTGANATLVENVRTYLRANADRKGAPGDPAAAPYDYTFNGLTYYYTFDGEREGIAQAPKQ